MIVSLQVFLCNVERQAGIAAETDHIIAEGTLTSVN